MDEGDLQSLAVGARPAETFFSEASQEERDEGHRVIRELKGKCFPKGGAFLPWPYTFARMAFLICLILASSRL